MQQATIGQLLDETIERKPGPCLYLVRDGATVLYIGQSYNIYARLESHMGMDRRKQKSALGEHVFTHLPHSREWTIELYAIEECEQVTIEHLQRLGASWYTKETYYSTGGAVDLAEMALIDLHHPLLNVTYNTCAP